MSSLGGNTTDGQGSAANKAYCLDRQSNVIQVLSASEATSSIGTIFASQDEEIRADETSYDDIVGYCNGNPREAKLSAFMAKLQGVPAKYYELESGGGYETSIPEDTFLLVIVG